MLSELQFALDSKVKMDVKKLNNREVLVSWNNYQNSMIITNGEAVSMGLLQEVKKEGVTFFLGEETFEKITLEQFEEIIEERSKKLMAWGKRIEYGVYFETDQQLKHFFADREDWTFFASRTTTRADKGKIKPMISYYTDFSKGVFANNNVKKRVSRTLKLLNEKFWN